MSGVTMPYEVWLRIADSRMRRTRILQIPHSKNGGPCAPYHLAIHPGRTTLNRLEFGDRITIRPKPISFAPVPSPWTFLFRAAMEDLQTNSSSRVLSDPGPASVFPFSFPSGSYQSDPSKASNFFLDDTGTSSTCPISASLRRHNRHCTRHTRHPDVSAPLSSLALDLHGAVRDLYHLLHRMPALTHPSVSVSTTSHPARDPCHHSAALRTLSAAWPFACSAHIVPGAPGLALHTRASPARSSFLKTSDAVALRCSRACGAALSLSLSLHPRFSSLPRAASRGAVVYQRRPMSDPRVRSLLVLIPRHARPRVLPIYDSQGVLETSGSTFPCRMPCAFFALCPSSRAPAPTPVPARLRACGATQISRHLSFGRVTVPLTWTRTRTR
ncbi:hypothetical protein K438DRAFT_2017595 [Mycena galopus ATCC 62051]|nr:hypothetical protein K438DRAFT_2017595 [Mycena galopus ATCC 62051]